MSTNKLVFAALFIIAGVSVSLADVASGYEWRDYNVNTRSSLCGWVSYQHQAQRCVDEHRRQRPGHNIVMQSRSRN